MLYKKGDRVTILDKTKGESLSKMVKKGCHFTLKGKRGTIKKVFIGHQIWGNAYIIRLDLTKEEKAMVFFTDGAIYAEHDLEYGCLSEDLFEV
jgi:hypothetical protein